MTAIKIVKICIQVNTERSEIIYICKRFVTINYFLLSVLSCKCFLVGFKAVSEPPIPEHVQGKEYVFEALTLE